MSKIMIPATYCKVGDVLADDVTNDEGITLVVKNTVVNKYIKNKFTELQIPCIWLYEPSELMDGRENEIKLKKKKETYKNVVLNLKCIINELTAGDKVDYEKIVDISKTIFDSINESNHIIRCLLKIRDSDEYTYTHSINVAFYCMLIAKWLDLPELSIQDAIQAGLLHDIGKVKTPNEILNKNGKLTMEEFEVIKKHPIYGYDFIEDISGISQNIKKAVLSHHERSDGSGYPFGYSGSSISLLAKIVSVADTYDAMTQNRVYQKKKNPFDVFEMFSTTGTSVFDATVLDVFIKNIATFYVGANVILSNGDTGKIVYIPPQDILNPIINVKSNYIDLSLECSLKVVSLL